MKRIVLPEVDVWLRAFSRQQPDFAVVNRPKPSLMSVVSSLWAGCARGLLARTADNRQFRRLVQALGWLPRYWYFTRKTMLLPLSSAFRLRDRGVSIMPAQALMWVMANRVDGLIWSAERRWQILEPYGLPLFKAN